MENAARDPANLKIKVKHAITSQNKFRWDTRRAEERGMRVNTSKTSMICVSNAMSYQAEAFIKEVQYGQKRLLNNCLGGIKY